MFTALLIISCVLIVAACSFGNETLNACDYFPESSISAMDGLENAEVVIERSGNNCIYQINSSDFNEKFELSLIKTANSKQIYEEEKASLSDKYKGQVFTADEIRQGKKMELQNRKPGQLASAGISLYEEFSNIGDGAIYGLDTLIFYKENFFGKIKFDNSNKDPFSIYPAIRAKFAQTIVNDFEK